MTLRPGLGFRSQANRCMNRLIMTFDMAPPSAISESAYLDEKVRNFIMSRLPSTLQRYVEKASTRSGTITIVLCQYLLIGSAREAYIKKQGELYFGITLLICSHHKE